MDEKDTSEPSTLAARYDLGPLLGHGGMGTVRDATDRRLGRPVAVKILRAELAAQPKARRRFETEARAAARLAHPNVVTVFDSGEDDGIPFLVMERLPGRTFADELRAGPASPERTREVAREILAAIGAAHDAGIMHRDIKPGNVLLTEAGHAKVSDFGIAKTVDDADQTQTTELIATPGYLAPERLAGEAASQRSDLYSVGVLLYEALAGRCPFVGDTPMAVLRAIEQGRAEPLSSVRPGLPHDLVSAIERAMSLDPHARFDSADAMATALEPLPDLDATVSVDLATMADTVPVVVGSSDGETQTLPGSGRGARPRPVRPRARSRILAFGVGAVLVAVLVGFAATRHDHGQAAPAAPTPTTSARVTPTPANTPNTTRLPAPLDSAIRRLEQDVAK
jgi:serine/threonine-protein kinase